MISLPNMLVYIRPKIPHGRFIKSINELIGNGPSKHYNYVIYGSRALRATTFGL